MEIDLLSIQPHQVSRDLRGYSVFFYGTPKCGKTSISTRFPNHLLLATEKGYNAIPGAMAQPINTWAEIKKIVRQLKNPEVQKKFETIIIDTSDLAYSMCEKYILTNNGVDKVSEIPYGGGYNLIANEFDEVLQSIVRMNYGLVLISHAQEKTFTNEKGLEYTKIIPTLGNKARNICSRLCDIVGYAQPEVGEDGKNETYLYTRGTQNFLAGSRFKYMPEKIPFNYNSLVQAINDAINKEMEETDEKLFTDSRNNLFTPVLELDFDALKAEFDNIISSLVKEDEEKFNSYFTPRINQIIEKNLGKGKKVTNCSRDQVEALSLIVDELNDLIKKENG